MSKTEP